MSAEPILALQVAVVDLDLLWSVEVANAVTAGGTYADQFPSIAAALDQVAPSAPLVVVVGPATLAEPDDDAWAAPERLVHLLREHADVHLLLVGSHRPGPPPGLDPDAEPDIARRWHDLPVDDGSAFAGAAKVATAAATLASAARAELDATGPAAAPLDAHVVVVTGAKAGEGATTVAVNLAVALATDVAAELASAGDTAEDAAGDTEGALVALVETSPSFGDIALGLGLPAAELVDDPAFLDVPERRVDALIRHHRPSGMAVVLPPRSTDPRLGLPVTAVHALIRGAAARARIVVIDAPLAVVLAAGLGTVADQVLLVVRPTPASVKNAAIAVDALGAGVPAALVLDGVVHSRVLRRRSGPTTEQVVAAVGRPVLAELPDVAVLREQPELGPLALAADDDGSARTELLALARRVAHLAAAPVHRRPS